MANFPPEIIEELHQVQYQSFGFGIHSMKHIDDVAEKIRQSPRKWEAAKRKLNETTVHVRNLPATIVKTRGEHLLQLPLQGPPGVDGHRVATNGVVYRSTRPSSRED